MTLYPLNFFQLFGECYKLLEKLHGPQYIENIDRVLDKSVRGFERESRGNNISEHQKSVSVDPNIGCGKEATDSVHDKDFKISEVRTLPSVKEHKSPSVQEQCKYFDPKITEKNFRVLVKRGDKCNTLKRLERVPVIRKKAVDITSKQRSSQFIRKRCAIFEGEVPRNLCKKQNCYTNSSHSTSRFTNNISNTTARVRRSRSFSKYERVNRSLGNSGSGSESESASASASASGSGSRSGSGNGSGIDKLISGFNNKLNISVDNDKKPSPIICSSSSNSSNSSSNNSNKNNQNNRPPESTRPIITDLSNFSLSNSSRNSTNSGAESFQESGKVEKTESSNKVQLSTVQNQTIPSSTLQNNHCQEVLEKCDEVTQLDSRLTIPTPTVFRPFQVQYKTTKTHFLGHNYDAEGLQTESGSCIYKVKIEVHCSPPNEEETPSEHGSSSSNKHYNNGSPSGDMLSSVTKEISYTDGLSIDIGNIEQPPENEQQTFVCSCEPYCTSTAYLPSQEERVESGELHNDYPESVESGELHNDYKESVESGELHNDYPESVESGELHNDYKESVESVELHNDYKESVESAELHNDYKESVESVELHNDYKENVESAELHNDYKESVESGELHNDYKESVESGELHNDYKENVESAELHNDYKESVESGELYNDYKESVKSGELHNDYNESVESGELHNDYNESVESGELHNDYNESVESCELRNDYKPMNASFRKNCCQFKLVTPSELATNSACGTDDCGHEYEDLQPYYTNHIRSGRSTSSLLSTYDFPLYQLYDFERVS